MSHLQALAAMAANLGQLTAGHCISTSSFLLPQLQSGEEAPFLSEEEGSWFASMLVVGTLTGTLAGGWQSHHLGRRRSMMVDGLLLSLGILVTSCSSSLAMLLVGRFVAGHGFGSNTATVPMFVAETSQPGLRGSLGTLHVFSISVGYTSQVSISLGYKPLHGIQGTDKFQMLLGATLPWRWAVGLPAILPLVSCGLLLVVHDSPSSVSYTNLTLPTNREV